MGRRLRWKMKNTAIANPGSKFSEQPKREDYCMLLSHYAVAARKYGLFQRVQPTAKKGMFMKNLKPVPKFKSEAEERKFWETHDSTEYLDWSKAQHVRFPNLKPTTKSITVRLPLWLLEALKVEANKRDVPYQSLLKIWLNEKLGEQSFK